MAEAWRSHPAVQRIGRVARALAELTDEVVFIGGAVAPLLQTSPPFARARPTKDVDATMDSRGYCDLERLHERLVALGFSQNPGDPGHLHRWVSPVGDWLDLVPAGDHPGGSSPRWDQIALETSWKADLGGGIIVRHASAPAFLALKWAAYQDRGKGDAFLSHDLEDLLALVASRSTLTVEVRASRAELAEFLADASAELLNHPELDDLLAGHLNNAQDPVRVASRVKQSLGLLQELGT